MVQHFQLLAVVRLSECRKKHSFYSRKGKHSGCQWRVETVSGAVGPAISGSCSTDSTSRKDTANVANIPKTTMFNWPINTNHDCKRFIYVLTRNYSNDNPFLVYNRSLQLSTFPATASRVCECDPSALEGGCTRRKVGNCNDLSWGSKTIIWFFLRIVFSL